MKVRNGFVSNSSSSSFVIPKDKLTELQIGLIKNHIENGARLGIEWSTKGNEWDITETGDKLTGETWMDNFDMEEYLRLIGVDMKHVKFYRD